ncbi:MAG: amidohydrolase, partial [Akkermansiaceae bacterium]|nr:amidohydrolase [Akkermansiaceae bacterium]
MKTPSRRDFLHTATLATASSVIHGCSRSKEPPEPEPFKGIVDVHQHAGYLDRLDEQLVAHQEIMGITQTVMLPSATAVSRPSTHEGASNGLAARARGNEACLRITEADPKHYAFFVNEVPDLPTARTELEKYLEKGAIGIGEQKFGVDCDSKHIELVASIARVFD